MTEHLHCWFGMARNAPAAALGRRRSVRRGFQSSGCRLGRGRRLISVVLGSVALLGLASTASAQADAQQKAAAEALFDAGRRQLAAGHYTEACRLLHQSNEIDSGVGTLLYLAECYERSGKLASAWAIFREASSAAQAAGQGDRSRLADERARQLAPQLSKLVLLAPKGNRPPQLEVLFDGRPVSSALFGVPFPVDAGDHELVARGPGLEPWSTVVTIKSRGDYRTIRVPALAPAARAAVSAPPPPAVAAVPAAPPHADVSWPAEPASSPSAQRLAGIIVGGAGLAVLGTGVVFGLRAADKDDRAERDCPSACLTRQAALLNEEARSDAVVANVAYGISAAALLAGAVLYFTAPPEASGRDAGSAGALRLSPLANAESAPARLTGISLSGVF